ncbi:hypothetical protein PM082_014728 [Marasmius tenuissimus]|nr:hypothetical protein PM082_014728 [Marasmius tenuissimus]
MLRTSRLTTLLSSSPLLPIATDSNSSGSNNSQAKIIGGAIGGGGFLVLLIVIFLFRRRRSKQARDRLQDSEKAAAVIDPFTPTTPVLNPPRERKESSPIPASNRKAVEGSNRQVTETTGGKQSTDPRQSETVHRGGESLTRGVDNRPVDRASYQALQAQVRLLMQRMERVEGVEEAPPEYVPAYSSR